MRLVRLALVDWRNISAATLDTDSGFLIFSGENGAGKTNLLEAMGVVSTLKSFRAAPWRDMIRWGASLARISATVTGQAGTVRLGVEVGSDGRRVFMDGSETRDSAHYFKNMRAVVFSPGDVEIVRGGPEYRRRFLDRATFNSWPAHLQNVRAFRRTLAQKAALLRRGNVDPGELEAWNQRLVPLGAGVSLSRARLVAALKDPLDHYHRLLSGGMSASIQYRSVLGTGSRAEMELRYGLLLNKIRKEELRREMNLVGPQRDDAEILLSTGKRISGADGDLKPERAVEGVEMRSARRFASQGQVRTLALSLKLAELAVAVRDGDPPLMLLDDLSSEIDDGRLGRLLEVLESLDAQVAVTTTDPSGLVRRLGARSRTFQLVSGRVDYWSARG